MPDSHLFDLGFAHVFRYMLLYTAVHNFCTQTGKSHVFFVLGLTLTISPTSFLGFAYSTHVV